MTRRLIIRADAGRDIGLGHVMRCMAVAEESLARGVDTRLVIGGRAGVSAARRRGYSVTATRRGRPRLDDVRPSDVVVIDGYHFASTVAEEGKDRGAVVVVVDDRADATPVADVVVAPDVTVRDPAHRSQAVLLDGPRHALVRREFSRRRRLRDGVVAGPLLVAMGGSDLHRLSTSVGQAARRGRWPRVEVLVGPATAVGIRDPLVRLVVDPLDVGAVFDRAGAVVSAAGSSAWELLSMGQVCALVAVAWDQEPVVDLVGSAGAALTHSGLNGLTDFVETTGDRLADPALRRSMSQSALDLVDGGGPRRVVDTILSL